VQPTARCEIATSENEGDQSLLSLISRTKLTAFIPFRINRPQMRCLSRQ